MHGFYAEQHWERPEGDVDVMLCTIASGMIIECLSCGKDIEVNKDTIVLTYQGEFLYCPHCGYIADIQRYHLYGKRKDNEQ